jgi:hypothetical protein
MILMCILLKVLMGRRLGFLMGKRLEVVGM